MRSEDIWASGQIEESVREATRPKPDSRGRHNSGWTAAPACTPPSVRNRDRDRRVDGHIPVRIFYAEHNGMRPVAELGCVHHVCKSHVIRVVWERVLKALELGSIRRVTSNRSIHQHRYVLNVRSAKRPSNNRIPTSNCVGNAESNHQE